MVKVEKAFAEDALLLSQISFAAKRHWNYPEEWISLWAKDLTITPDYIQQNVVFKLIQDKEIVGFCAMESGTDWLEIAHLWIKPEYIGKGYGKLLLQESLKLSSFGNFTKVKVEADPNAEGFYRNFGFKTFARKESTPPGRLLPVMEMELHPTN